MSETGSQLLKSTNSPRILQRTAAAARLDPRCVALRDSKCSEGRQKNERPCLTGTDMLPCPLLPTVTELEGGAPG